MRGRELVGGNIRRIRVAANISQERLAFDSGVDRSYLGGIERGEENPTIDVLERLCTTLEIELIELFQSFTEGKNHSDGLPKGRKKKN